MTKVTKAVIPAGGYGLNFMPATKAQPKELLPIVDKPIIQFIVEEAFESGIEEILIITGKHKRSIEDHFDSNIELEENLKSKGKVELLNLAQSTIKANLFFVRQSEPRGLGDAILHAKAFVNDEPFVVLLGDNIMLETPPVTKQLIDFYEEYQAPVVAVTDVAEQDAHKYGIIDIIEEATPYGEDVFKVKQFIEKPRARQFSSNLAIAGRYILTPDIFPILEQTQYGVDNELQLTDALEYLNRTHSVFAKKIKGRRYDVGDKIGYMRMCIDYGLSHAETKEQFQQFIMDKAQDLTLRS